MNSLGCHCCEAQGPNRVVACGRRFRSTPWRSMQRNDTWGVTGDSSDMIGDGTPRSEVDDRDVRNGSLLGPGVSGSNGAARSPTERERRLDGSSIGVHVRYRGAHRAARASWIHCQIRCCFGRCYPLFPSHMPFHFLDDGAMMSHGSSLF